MADYAGVSLGAAPLYLATPDPPPAMISANCSGVAPAGDRYVMGWNDTDCGSPTLRSWVATFEDVTGTEYTGPKCGATPITDAFVMQVLPPA